jgi:AcrR family transcriptional regulator
VSPKTTARRIGRPPDSDSADTRRRILDVARAAFATNGFEASTNRDLAHDAGITPGALYYHFGSKLELYLAVDRDVRALVSTRFSDAVDHAEGFLGKLEAVLDAAHEMNQHDPTLAAFVGAVRIDTRRNNDVLSAVTDGTTRLAAFFARLIDEGIDTGEIPAHHRQLVIDLVDVLLVGLTDGVSNDIARHGRAIEAIKKLFRGQLVNGA